MRPALLAVLLSTACAAAPPLWTSRLAYEPLLARLREAGGDPVKAVSVHGVEDLAVIHPSKRYQYVVRRDGLLVIAPRPLDDPKNEYTHPILARGQPVRTAGVLHVEHRGAGAEDELIFVDQDSQAYCPDPSSLVEARAALARVNIARERVRFEDHPPTCAPLPGDGGSH